MTDLLVKLYDLPDSGPYLAVLAEQMIDLHRPMASQKNQVVAWVRQRFGDGWAAECEIAFARQPIACMLAVSGGRIAGFACHECTRPNFFGPIGIDPEHRRLGIGRALLVTTLHAMAHAGYAYAIIGGAGPVDFFEKCVGGMAIPGSTPGIYRPAIHPT